MTKSMVRIGVVMDPIDSIKPYKDSTFAMLLAAQARGWRISYSEMADLSVLDGVPYLAMRDLSVRDEPSGWFELGEPAVEPASRLDVVLMRKDPPFDMEYIYATYFLERAKAAGVLVVNDPSALRDVSEKAYTAWYPDLCPPTLFARRMSTLRAFGEEHGRVVVKPLDGMGGRSIFVVRADDPNFGVILETITDGGRRFVTAQKYIPEIRDGDKRILIVDGEPVPYCLARIPAKGEHRGNLAAGASSEARPLSERDREIAHAVAPMLRDKKLLFVGLDVIGDYLTEINVTSPTCIRELDEAYGLDIADDLLGAIERRLD